MTSTIATERTGLVARWKALPGSARSGLVLSVLGFLIHFEVKNETFANGQPVCEAFDFGPWIIGFITIVTGIVTVVEARKADNRLLVLGLGLVIIGFGVFHVLTAYQVFLPIC
jgi:hypothetical protein